MSFLGIDVGTTRCKVAVFSGRGEIIASSYTEYDICRPEPGWTELNASEIWFAVRELIKKTVESAGNSHRNDPVTSIGISSLGEATVPVTEDRRILGNSILNSDMRGQQYVEKLSSLLDTGELYGINGNVLGNHYSLTKLLWIKENQPEMYQNTYKFLHWSPFIAFMLGAEPVVDYSLANRTLLFDLEKESWSEHLLELAGLDAEKLPDTATSGRPVGTVAAHIAGELGLPEGVVIATGAHDQCSNALGCGVVDEGSAMYGMGTVTCIVPVFASRKNTSLMIPRGLNTEHHAVQNRYVSFIYNQGGCLVKWFRDTFARSEHIQAKQEGREIYDRLFSEMPSAPSHVTE